MTHKGIPDGSRAARLILKDYVNGKLLFCYPPPGHDVDDFQQYAIHLTLKTDDNDNNHDHVESTVVNQTTTKVVLLVVNRIE
jgi:ribosome biogenesis GTPase A